MFSPRAVPYTTGLKAAKFLHAYMLTEQPLLASTQQYIAGSSVICVLLLGARNIEYLHVFLFTKKHFCHEKNSFGNNVDICLVLCRHRPWLPAASSTCMCCCSQERHFGRNVDICLVLCRHRPWLPAASSTCMCFLIIFGSNDDTCLLLFRHRP